MLLNSICRKHTVPVVFLLAMCLRWPAPARDRSSGTYTYYPEIELLFINGSAMSIATHVTLSVRQSILSGLGSQKGGLVNSRQTHIIYRTGLVGVRPWNVLSRSRRSAPLTSIRTSARVWRIYIPPAWRPWVPFPTPPPPSLGSSRADCRRRCPCPQRRDWQSWLSCSPLARTASRTLYQSPTSTFLEVLSN